MRGKPFRKVSAIFSARLIPAHAGKTQSGLAARYVHEAHPRACGENHLSIDLLGARGGSSPRMRGKHAQSTQIKHLRRLIPAHAGKTPDRPSSSLYRGAHPRACGENTGELSGTFYQDGSSPRMRGKHIVVLRLRHRRGLIPAHAGKTRLVSLVSSWARAHPRACGENLISALPQIIQTGSSPRMRGKRTPSQSRALGRGLIPAHAGKTDN